MSDDEDINEVQRECGCLVIVLLMVGYLAMVIVILRRITEISDLY